jgi:signal recognition particle subunit SRP54
MSGVLGFLPGMGGMKKKLEGANLDDKLIKRQGAIISSMTLKERKNPKVLQASRKRRIAAGSGTTVQEINQLLKMHRQMADMMKSIGKGKGGLAKLFGMGGGMPQVPPEALAAAKAGQFPPGMKLPGGAGGGLPGLPGLPGVPKGFGGLPGLPGKKK